MALSCASLGQRGPSLKQRRDRVKVSSSAEAVDASGSTSSAASPSSSSAMQAPAPPLDSIIEQTPMIHAPLLPEINLGTLRGGRYPFMYDPVYGLPIVRNIASYADVLRDIRLGRVKEILWFATPPRPGSLPQGSDFSSMEGRCLIRYKNDEVKQSMLFTSDLRLNEAIRVHAVKEVTLPSEPRHIEALVEGDTPSRADLHPITRFLKENANYYEQDGRMDRRGPRIGPTPAEGMMLDGKKATRDRLLEAEAEQAELIGESFERMNTEDYQLYLESAGGGGRGERGEAGERVMSVSDKKVSWMDSIQITQEQQALILRYVPILGPIIGSAFIIGLYMAARLVRGDLTDRMKMVGQEDEKKKRTALKEARIAFLEEEVPAMVAKGAKLPDLVKKSLEVNKRLGEKFSISESELEGTYEACLNLLGQGEDISGAQGSSNAASRILAEEEAKEKAAAQKEATSEGTSEAQQQEEMAQEMAKLNTARVRKAIDPKILEVKRRVRQARRTLKRESKVQLSDEIIFFDDVAGNEQAKVELQEVVDFFRKPEKFKSSGAKAPKGVLLVGPPGNGKTLMARAVAGESGVAFISSSASEFIEMYMGLGAARVRDLFNTARGLSPCIIFIDELDAVGRARRGAGGGNDERDNTVNQLLTELDGFEAETTGIVVMGATNRKDVLDAALTRAGRFDRSIEVTRPNFSGRVEGIKVHLRDKPVGDDVDYREMALMTSGMSGAQVAGVCNSACFIASREGRAEVTMADLRLAVEQSKYGRSADLQRFISPGRKQRFAVMEASISLVATLLPAIEPVDFTTILPSVKSPIGRTVLKPNIGRYTTGMWTKRYLEEQLLVALAGRAGEEVVFGRDGMSSLQQSRNMLARQIASKMLNSGMSDHPDYANLRGLGNTWYDTSFEPGRFQTYTVTTDNDQTQSEWVDMDVEMEVRVNGSYEKVKAMIERNRMCLDLIVRLLLEAEKVSGDEIRAIVEGAADPADLEARKREAGVML